MKILREEADILVVGGGTAGVIAAIQAARLGARTVVLEMTGQLGGTMTNGGVSAPAHFFNRGRQVIAGIGWELVTKTKALDGTPLPDFNNPPPNRPSHHVSVNPYLYACLAEESCLEAGVTLHYHEVVTTAEARGDRWLVESVGKGVRREVLAREVIDCSGDADVVGLLGFERVKGEVRQPGTLEFRLEGYDYKALDADLLQARYEEALRDGTLIRGDFCYARRPFIDYLRAGGANLQHLFGADSTTSETQTEANIAGRQGLLRMLRFLKTLPGCEKVRIARMYPMAAIRETYRIVGETTITREDYLSGRRFDDAVAYTFYFIDVHTEEGTDHEFLEEGVVPTLPLGALVPKGSQRLLVAGRTVSSDRRANSALRVEASCMAMGQAAGAAAALGVRQGVPSRDVPLDLLRDTLRAHGALVP
ncbi:MAG: FAD-dependent oxidoreductase [Armatimonadetes bacterium]|nr:FAD-dependent oxidoreductase [Armatimonadota bacterium]